MRKLNRHVYIYIYISSFNFLQLLSLEGASCKG